MSEDAAPRTPGGGDPAGTGSQAKLRLKVTGGDAAGTELMVADELVIGREAPGEGQIADVEISRQHARISRTPEDQWAIEDLGSRNGTFVNGHRLEQPQQLAAGDAIELGGTRLVVQVSAPASTPGAEPAAQPEPEPDAELGATIVPDAVPPGAAEAPEPTEVAEPEPEPEPEPQTAAVPPVSLTLELDAAAGEAVISLGDGSDRVRLVFEDGGWRLRPES